MRLSRFQGYLFISPWLAGFLLLTAGPMLYSLYLSFTSATLLSPPVWIGFDNYAAIFRDDALFPASLANTLFYVALAVPLSITLSLALALLLHAPLRGLPLFRALFYLPSIANIVAVSVLWIWMLNPEFGLVNGLLRGIGIEGPLWLQSEVWAKPALVVMSLWGIGGMVVVFLAALEGVPRELHEAARIDGASAARRFFRITLPMISPAMLFSAIIGVIGGLQVFAQAYVMTGGAQPGSEGGPGNATLFAVLYIYKKAFQEFRMGYASALAWILFLLIIVATVAAMRLARSRVHYEGGEAA